MFVACIGGRFSSACVAAAQLLLLARRRWLVIAVVTAVSLSTLVVPAGAQDDADFVRIEDEHTVVFERTKNGPATLMVAYSSGGGERPGGKVGGESVLGAIGLRDGGKPRSVALGQAAMSNDSAPSARIGGERVGCPTAGCGVVGGAGIIVSTIELSDTGLDDPEALTHVFLVVDGDEPIIDYAADGWQARAVPLDFRYVTARGSTISAETGQVGPAVDLTEGAGPLTGGKWGSIAAGQLPCGYLPVGGMAGVGTAELVGGKPTVSMTCTSVVGDRQDAIGASHAAKTTTWQLETSPTPAAGFSSLSNVRLLVIDLPPPPEAESKTN